MKIVWIVVGSILMPLIGTSLIAQKKEFTAADHGRRQLNRMLSDIPKMAIHPKTGVLLPRQNALFTKVEELFAGKESGVPIFWKGVAEYYSVGRYFQPKSDSPAGIQLVRKKRRADQQLGFDELWAEAILNLVSITDWKEYNNLRVEAALGLLDFNDFIKKNVHLELLANKQRKDYYEKIWEPWAQSIGIDTDPVLWTFYGEQSFEEYYAEYKKDSRFLQASWTTREFKKLKEAAKNDIITMGPDRYESYLKEYYIPEPVSEILRSEEADVAFKARQVDLLKTVDRALVTKPKTNDQKAVPK